jgi:hypothetical protein
MPSTPFYAPRPQAKRAPKESRRFLKPLFLIALLASATANSAIAQALTSHNRFSESRISLTRFNSMYFSYTH